MSTIVSLIKLLLIISIDILILYVLWNAVVVTLKSIKQHYLNLLAFIWVKNTSTSYYADYKEWLTSASKYNQELILLKEPPTEVESELIHNSSFGEYANNLYKKEYLLTYSESRFFKRLWAYISNKDYIICPKVRMEDVIWITDISTEKWPMRPYWISWKLDRNHIDFVLIWKHDLRIKFAIELDDPTHNSDKSMQRDKIKNDAFLSAHVPLIRFKKVEPSFDDFKSKGIL